MARPRKIKPEETQEVESENTPVDDKEYKNLLDEIKSLKQEKEQLSRKLEKRSHAPQDVKTAQASHDIKSVGAMREEDSQKVKGIFRCFNPPGGNTEFYFRKYKGDSVEKYQMFDGQEYEVPMAVVRHLNENCYEEDKAYLLDANGNPIRGTGKRNHRFAFTPIEYGKKIAPVQEGTRQLALNEV